MAITITKPTIGGSNNTWGQTLNDSLDTIVNAVNGTSGTISPSFSAVTLGGWTITETGGSLYFASSGTNKMKLDTSGNLTVTGDVTGFGTIT